MCGICGIYDHEGGRPIEPTVLHDMMEAIRHRGPDDSGTHIDGSVGLGSRRLSIIDLQTGRQPVYNEDRTIAVVFNGEIYNYQQLRQDLESKGHRFRTAGDTEVIAHLYEDYGEDCVHKLRGMFGLAVWDQGQRKLFLARDRLGVKPLYYSNAGGRLVFASEIKSILRYPGISATPDLSGLSNYLSLKYVPAPQTMFSGIHALPPGHVISCGPSGVTTSRYWDLSFQQPAVRRTEADYAEELEELLRDSVRMRLMSDVPFGAFLSGGLDSSTIVALMSQLLERPVSTFSVGFGEGGEEFSELPFARIVAEEFESDHHEVIVKAGDLTRLAETLIWHLDQPIADPAVLGNYMVAELAAQRVKMVLTGEGGDELFAGYARYSAERLSGLFGAVPGSWRSAALALADKLPRQRRAKIALFALCQTDEVTRFTNWFPLFNQSAKRSLLSEDVKQVLGNVDANIVFEEQLAASDATHSLDRMLYLDTKLWLPDDLLARGDKMSMASSLEARVPLLDHKLVEFAGSLPAGLKLRGLTRKYLLKKVSAAWLPREIVHRKKKGFPMPMSLWFRGEARSFLRDHLSRDTIRRRGLFDPDFVEQLIQEHETRVADHASLLWGLLSVELWYRVFVDRATTEAFVPNAGSLPGLTSVRSR